MANLYGKPVKREELQKYLGNMAQVAGVRLATLEEGTEQGVKVAQVSTGSGFRFTVGLSRGMDIFDAEYCGRALALLTPTGFAAPTFLDPSGLGWLNTFGGGLVTTCGLTYNGSPCVDEGKALGLHGRISHLPASKVKVNEGWAGDEYEISIEGEVVEAVPVVGEHVSLQRKIRTRLGESRFWISDTVENLGYKSVPHMILYHINLGYPVLAEGSRVLFPSVSYRPRDDEAKKEQEKWMEIPAPIEAFAERVYFHNPGADKDGRTLTAVVNPNLDGGFALYAEYPREQLPKLSEWKMPAAGNYVVGIEPANCWTYGRALHREEGILEFLEPGEKRQYDLEIGVVTGKEAVTKIEERIRGMK